MLSLARSQQRCLLRPAATEPPRLAVASGSRRQQRSPPHRRVVARRYREERGGGGSGDEAATTEGAQQQQQGKGKGGAAAEEEKKGSPRLYDGAVFDFTQAEQVRVGDSLVERAGDATLLRFDEEEEEGKEGAASVGGGGMQVPAGDPKATPLAELLCGKRAVLFGLPGAYTSVCSSKHLPQFAERADELRAAGVDAVYCLSVNDPYVMQAWARALGVDTARVGVLADGEGLLHARLGLLQHMPGLGVRARRYSLLADDGVVAALHVEEPGGKSYKTSGPQTLLDDLARLSSSSASAKGEEKEEEEEGGAHKPAAAAQGGGGAAAEGATHESGGKEQQQHKQQAPPPQKQQGEAGGGKA